MRTLSELTNEELWQLFPVIISEHKEDWKENFLSESKELVEAIGSDRVVRINHIGSTAVPDLLAKPTIDILLEITEEIDIERLIKTIESEGYIYTYQPKNPAPHMMFMKGYTPEGFKGQAFHLHVRYSGDWNELYFRDYLLAHADVAQEYGELKLRLKEQFEHDRDAYTSAKTDFINRMTELARKEFPNRYKA